AAVGDLDSDQGVAGDEVARDSTGRGATADHDAVVAVGQSGSPGRAGPDAVVLHQGAGGPRAVDHHTVEDVARDQVAQRGRCTADRIAGGLDHHALLEV